MRGKIVWNGGLSKGHTPLPPMCSQDDNRDDYVEKTEDDDNDNDDEDDDDDVSSTNVFR